MYVIALLLVAAATPPKVAAVLELRNKLEGPDRNLVDSAFLTDVVRQQVLEGAPAVKLMTRENVLTLLEASGKKLEECEGECEVETGRRLGADVVVTGEILRFGSGFRANLRLHDTHSAQLLSAAVASGNSPEALEKDLSRAVGKLVTPLQSGYQAEPAKSAEWFETIGVYLTLDVGSIGVENDTPRALPPSANSLTLSNPKNNASELGVGVQYHPWTWLMIDAQYAFIGMNGKADSLSGDGRTSTGASTFTAPSFAFSANGLWRIRQWVRLFGGLGVQVFMARIGSDALDALDNVHFARVGGTGFYDQSAGFTRFFLRGGIELKPQERFGIQLFAVVFPVSQELDIYLNDVQGSAQSVAAPVLKYTMPQVKGNAAVVLYF